MGRRKVEMKKIVNKSARLVTFSKRRSGLFKKANEISTLCGAEVAIVVFSPAGKPFSFGQPTVNKVVHRFYNKSDGAQHCSDFTILHGKNNGKRIHRLRQELINLDTQIEGEYKKSGVLDKQGYKQRLEVKRSIEDLDYNQLTTMRDKMQNIFEESNRHIFEIEALDSLMLLASSPPLN